jgi:hypothetical protein
MEAIPTTATAAIVATAAPATAAEAMAAEEGTEVEAAAVVEDVGGNAHR